MEVPDAMRSAVEAVLAGEYEAGFSGENLTVLDIGANVGSFTIWANMRWPGSDIHAYEPDPRTFEMLSRNAAALRNARLYNFAVWPTQQTNALFFSRYAGDGEAGLTEYMGHTFSDMTPDRVFPVSVIHPSRLPKADIIKLDVEGAEWEILRNLNLSDVSLILLEFQNDTNRNAIKQHLANDFTLEHEDQFPWDDLLEWNPLYRRDLSGDHYGRVFFANRTTARLRRGSRDQS